MQITDANNNPLTREQVLEACDLNQIHPSEVNSNFPDLDWMSNRSAEFDDPARILEDYTVPLLTKLRMAGLFIEAD